MLKYKVSYILMLLSSIASAKEEVVDLSKKVEDKQYYITISGGNSKGERVGNSFPATDLTKTNVFSIAVGKKISEHFRFDVSVEQRRKYRLNWTQVDDEDNTKFEHSLKVNSLALMLNGYYDIINYKGFTPYIVLGFGPSYNVTRNAGITIIDEQGEVHNTSTISNGYKTSLAYKIGFGASYQISNSLDIGAQYQYVDLGKFYTGDNITNNSTSKNTYYVSQKGNLKTSEVVIAMSYKF